jgi:hypothetical protein
MSQTPEHPHDPVGHPGAAGQPAPAGPSGAPAQPPTDLGTPELLDSGQGPGPARGGRRGVLIGAGVLAAALVGGGVALAASKLSGGGAQPDQVVPASALAFVAVDADPSSGQKVEMLKFLRKFPEAKESLGTLDDPAKALFEALRKDGTLTGDYATDVKPWIGDRAGAAVLPPARDGEDPQVLLVLSVKDQDEARAGIKKITKGVGACELTDDFAVCAEEAGTARRAVADAARNPLADLKNYRDDLSSLGDQGVARAWLDLARIGESVPVSGAGGSAVLGGADLKGRAAMALRFEGADLELAGNTVGTGAPKITSTVDADELPADAVAVFGLAGSDRLVQQTWDGLAQGAQGANAGVDLDGLVRQLQDQYGISLPDDVRDAVGDRMSVVLGGSGGVPEVAVRVSGERQAVDKIVRASAGRSPFTVARVEAGTDTVLASSPGYARLVADGSGLGSVPTFADAVPGAENAQAVAFVDPTKAVTAFGDLLNLPPDVRANLAPISAIGMSARQDGDRSTFSVRVVTK